MKLKTNIAKNQHGFSLLEVMIVVAIVGILASIAYPAYQNHIRQVARSDGKTALLEAASRQERFFLENETYTTTMSALGYGSPANSPEGYYTLTTAACSGGNIANCFIITATVAKGTDSTCNTISLDSNGTKTATSAECW